MSVEETNKAIYRRVYEEIWSGGSMETVDEVVSDDWRSQGEGPDLRGKEGYKQIVRGFKKAFPDISFKIKSIIAEGDWVAVHTTCNGTHTGELPGGIAPTGKRFEVNELAMVRFIDSEIVEEWGTLDWLDLYRQLGVSFPGG